jgi:glucose-6-phosphate 1-dehydrogenase
MLRERGTFRIDHLPAKQAIRNILHLRFASSFAEPRGRACRPGVEGVSIRVCNQGDVGH